MDPVNLRATNTFPDAFENVTAHNAMAAVIINAVRSLVPAVRSAAREALLDAAHFHCTQNVLLVESAGDDSVRVEKSTSLTSPPPSSTRGVFRMRRSPDTTSGALLHFVATDERSFIARDVADVYFPASSTPLGPSLTLRCADAIAVSSGG